LVADDLTVATVGAQPQARRRAERINEGDHSNESSVARALGLSAPCVSERAPGAGAAGRQNAAPVIEEV